MNPWEERARRLQRPALWDDDEDILDAHDRAEARELIPPPHAGASMTPVQAVQVLNEPRKQWANPYVSLLDEVTRTQAYVVLLETQVQMYDAAGGAHRTKPGISTLSRFERERDRLLNACKTAISLGIAERQVRLAERQGELLSRAAIAAVDATPDLTQDQRRALLTNLATQLRTLDTQALMGGQVS